MLTVVIYPSVKIGTEENLIPRLFLASKKEGLAVLLVITKGLKTRSGNIETNGNFRPF